MSIRSLYGVPERKGQVKRAAVPEIAGLFGAMFNWSNAKLLAAAMLAGGAGGWFASKLTAKGESDMDTAKKAFQNERARADIGYLRTRLQDEYAKSKATDDERTMRLLS